MIALELVLVPLLVGGITLAGRRWGPTVAGWLSAFPVISAPILFFVAREQGLEFAATAAAATFSAVLANVAFGLAYAWTARRHAWPLCLAAGMAAFFAGAVLLGAIRPPLLASVPVVLAILVLARHAYPAREAPAVAPGSAGNDLPLRMAAGAALVVGVTAFAAALGPTLSGVLAMFPVMASCLAVFSHRASGAAFATRLLRGMVLGYYSFGAFCLVLCFTLTSWGIGPAFLAALGAAAVAQAASRGLLRAAPHPAGRP